VKRHIATIGALEVVTGGLIRRKTGPHPLTGPPPSLLIVLPPSTVPRRNPSHPDPHRLGACSQLNLELVSAGFFQFHRFENRIDPILKAMN
jgi:hypothetical protein